MEDGAFEVTQVVIGRTAAAQPEQFRLVLDQVDSDSPLGIRDAALLLFLYNTGARVSEVLQITWSDLHLDRPAQVRLHGKGNNYAKVVVMQIRPDLGLAMPEQSPAGGVVRRRMQGTHLDITPTPSVLGFVRADAISTTASFATCAHRGGALGYFT